MDVARMHRPKAPPSLDFEDIQQDARKWALLRYKEGFRGAWLAQRIWGDMKDEYGRVWKKHYEEVAAREAEAVKPGHPGARPVSYEDPDQSITLDVHAALDCLPDLQRRIVIECDMNGRRQDLIAIELSISVAVLKRTLDLARASLRESLKEYNTCT